MGEDGEHPAPRRSATGGRPHPAGRRPRTVRRGGRYGAATVLLLALVLFLAVSGPAGRHLSTSAPLTGTGCGEPVSATPASPATAMVEAAEQVVSDRPEVRLGVAVLDRETGDVTTGTRGACPVRAASLAKLLTATDLLDRRSAAGIDLSAQDLDLIRRALGASDDRAMNQLWSRFDGPGGVDRVAGLLDLQETSPPGDEGRWGDVLVSARDVVTVFGYLVDGLAAADRALVLGSMAAAPTIAADGFDQGFGLLEPGARGTAVAKQGWACCTDGELDLNSAGMFSAGDRYVVALLSTQPPGDQRARGVLDAAATAMRVVVSRGRSGRRPCPAHLVDGAGGARRGVSPGRA